MRSVFLLFTVDRSLDGPCRRKIAVAGVLAFLDPLSVMPLYIEHWNARPSWLALPLADRIEYLDEMGPAIESLNQEGATLVGMALTEDDDNDRTDEHYVAIWLMPDGTDQVRQLEDTLESAGWHKYFEPDTSA